MNGHQLALSTGQQCYQQPMALIRNAKARLIDINENWPVHHMMPSGIRHYLTGNMRRAPSIVSKECYS